MKQIAVEAFNAIQASRNVSPKVKFVVSDGFLHVFMRCYNLKSHLRCGESGSAELEGVQLARDALPKVLANLKITSVCDV